VACVLSSISWSKVSVRWCLVTVTAHAIFIELLSWDVKRFAMLAPNSKRIINDREYGFRVRALRTRPEMSPQKFVTQ
jgi:hypothetical protein